jgi:hypothetical protein
VIVLTSVGASAVSSSVSITAPASGATVSGNVSVTATATDSVGVTKVELYVDGALSGTDTTIPYNFTWDSTVVSDGTHTLSAKVYGASGGVGTSPSVTVTVSNTGGTVPPGTTNTVSFGNATGSNYLNTVEETFLNINNDVNAASTTLIAYTWPTNAPSNTILLKWDLSALPANAVIQNATLNLYMTGSGGDALYAMPAHQIINKLPIVAKCNGNLYDGTNQWTANSVTSNGTPLAQLDIAAAVDTPLMDSTLGYKSWNVTDIVKAWVASTGNNRGILLNASNKASANSYRQFASSKLSDPSQRPKLVITYTTGLTVPALSIKSISNP